MEPEIAEHPVDVIDRERKAGEFILTIPVVAEPQKKKPKKEA